MHEQFEYTSDEQEPGFFQRVRRLASGILQLRPRRPGVAESAGPALSVREQLDQLLGAGDTSRRLTRVEGARWRATLLGLVQEQQRLRPARSIVVNDGVESIYSGYEQRTGPTAETQTIAAV